MNTDFVEGTMENANQMIGCCGLDCEKCDARIATIANGNTLREKTAALWTTLNGVTITPEMINCTGCRIDGAKTPFYGCRFNPFADVCCALRSKKFFTRS